MQIADPAADQEEVISLVSDLWERMQDKADEALRIQRYQEMLRMPVTNFAELDETTRYVLTLCQLCVLLYYYDWAARNHFAAVM